MKLVQHVLRAGAKLDMWNQCAMMMRYFFDVDDGTGLSADDEGVECANLASARTEVMRSLPAIAAEAIGNDGDRANFEMTVRDGIGTPVMRATLSFAFDRL